jgi:hypothetical protein
MRWLYVLFWLFIATMLAWQAIDYNSKQNQAAIAHPQQQQFFFYNTNNGPVIPPPPVIDGPNVVQASFDVRRNDPSFNMFTCYVTVKNIGNAKATNIALFVRPYRGAVIGDEDNNHTTFHVLAENDPISQVGQWINFPDLNPGQTSGPQHVTFTVAYACQIGINPDPKITFDKATP